MALAAGESVVAQTVARMDDDDVDGTLVLTTTRLVFLVDNEIVYEADRANIEYVRQDLTVLMVRAHERQGVAFLLPSPRAGPVSWAWHLEPLDAIRIPRDGTWGRHDDPRVGMVDAARRAVLVDWEKRVQHFTFRAPDHFLDGVSEAPIDWQEIIEIVYIADGKADGEAWLLVVRLADGRWGYFQHVVQITGDVYTTIVVAATLETLWWGAFTESDRDRVTAQMTQERRDEELVLLDSILESPDDRLREHAEQRMALIKLGRRSTG